MPQDKPKAEPKDKSYMWIEPGWVEPGDKVAKPKPPPAKRKPGPPERMPLVPNYGRRRRRLLRA